MRPLALAATGKPGPWPLVTASLLLALAAWLAATIAAVFAPLLSQGSKSLLLGGEARVVLVDEALRVEIEVVGVGAEETFRVGRAG